LRKSILVGLILVLSVTLCSSDVTTSPTSLTIKAHNVSILSDYVVHSPILIEDSTNSSEFVSLSIPGNGTMGDPFVIEGLSIDGNGASPCIEIRNPRASYGETSCYFVIRDCYLYNGTDGIYMTDATVGVIEYNMIVDSADGWGIEITQGNTMGLVWNLTIRNNNLSGNYNGNVMTFWGTSRNITIMNNVGYGRVFLEVQRNTSIFNNTFSDIFVRPNIHRSELSIINNTVDYIEIDEFADILTHDSVIIVANNTITDRLKILDSENCEVYDNDFITSRRWMLLLQNADNNTFTSNVFYTTSEGAFFNIDSSSDDNLFDYNFYYDYQGVDENDDNIGDSPYDKWEVVDQHPLMSLRGFETVHDTIEPMIDGPDDFQYESGSTNNRITWRITEVNPSSFEVTRNGTILDSGPWDGSDIVVVVDGLDFGTYNFTLVVSDTSNNNASSTVMVLVVDTINPVINSLEDTQFTIGTIGHSLTWTLQDTNPFNYEVVMDSIVIASGSWNSTGETVTIILDNMTVGTHFITITITDLAGNEASDVVIVSILPESTTTTDTTSIIPTDSQFQLIAILGLGVGFGVLLSVIVFVVQRKRE